MKVYRGKTDSGQKSVTVDSKPLDSLYSPNSPRYSPFDWGTKPASPGAVHLAEAILANLTGRKTPNPLARDFANKQLSMLPLKAWEIDSDLIDNWLRIQGDISRSAQRAVWPSSDADHPSAASEELRLHDFPRFPNWLDELRERIKPDELARQGFPRPKDVRLSQDTDSTGEAAFYVYLVFPDKTPEEALAWDEIEPMVSWVRNLIWTETGARHWPYV